MNTEKEKKASMKSRLSGMLELPKEIMLNLPLVTVIGSEEVTIENYKSVIEYSQTRIRVNTSSGIFKIEGKNLTLKQITSEAVVITGIIGVMAYI